MAQDVSTLRLYLMRALYLLNFALGLYIWPWLLKEGLSDPWQAVAFTLYASLFALSGLGLRYPLRMLPLLLLQLLYKLIWLMTVALRLLFVHRSSDFTSDMIIGLVLDLIVIPWPYVLAHYVKERGDLWRPQPSSAARSRAHRVD